jgi:hypothetical protein
VEYLFTSAPCDKHIIPRPCFFVKNICSHSFCLFRSRTLFFACSDLAYPGGRAAAAEREALGFWVWQASEAAAARPEVSALRLPTISQRLAPFFKIGSVSDPPSRAANRSEPQWEQERAILHDLATAHEHRPSLRSHSAASTAAKRPSREGVRETPGSGRAHSDYKTAVHSLNIFSALFCACIDIIPIIPNVQTLL